MTMESTQEAVVRRLSTTRRVVIVHRSKEIEKMEKEKYQTMEVVEAAKEPCAMGTKEEDCKPQNIRTVRCKVCGYERKGSSGLSVLV
jgi:hypothetical protein